MSTLDFDNYSEVIGPLNSQDVGDTTIIFTHREGWTRASFRSHARYLAEKYGYRSILVDYPGHGSRCDEECTLENCVKAVSEALVAHNIPTARASESAGKKTIFASSSWGGVMAYHIVAELKEYFSGAIFDSCCFDVSSPRKKNRWNLFSSIIGCLSCYEQVRFQRAWLALKGNSYIDFITGNFGAGNFNRSGTSMKKAAGKDLFEAISEIKCPVLFINGTKDRSGYSDRATKKVMNLLEAKDDSKVVLFEGGDHMISHDLRFFDSWVETAASFAHYASVLPKRS